MSSPSYELQVAIVTRLRSASSLADVIDQRVYDVVPHGATFPYVTVGPGDETSDDADCVEGYEISLDIDIWSREPGYQQAKTLSALVRSALRSPELTIAGHALVLFQHRQTRFLRDPDGLTSHAVLTFEGFTEQP